jgi:uncharacterized protein (TIGR03032 family)
MSETDTQHDTVLPPEAAEAPVSQREVKFRYSREFLPLLERLGASLLITTYQAGKLVVLGARDSQLNISLHNFEQAMGIAVQPQRIAIGGRGQVWFLNSAPELAERLEPAGRFDACFLTRKALVTGNIQGHEMAWIGQDLWIVNTAFSCLCTLDEQHSFVPRWKPPFISDLEAGDRCHLNGLALQDGRPKYVTAMSESNQAAGWRPTKASSGCIIDVDQGEVVSRGLSMPHSPRVHRGQLWVLNSGFGSVEIVQHQTGKRDTVALLPGYTRGFAFADRHAFVGLSRIRETAVFGGVPIAEHREQLRCGVAVIDLDSGAAVAYFEFLNGVEEIFDVQVLPDARCVGITGPYPQQDSAEDVWIVPGPRITTGQ